MRKSGSSHEVVVSAAELGEVVGIDLEAAQRRRTSGEDAAATGDRRASLRPDQGPDGSTPPPNEDDANATEMALHVLAYNLTRVMNIMGIQPLMAAMRT